MNGGGWRIPRDAAGRAYPRRRRTPLRMPVYRRKRLPLDRVVRWSPTQDGYYLVASMLASSREAALLCATQHTLLQVEAHRRERGGGDCFGLLIGGLYECPTQFV